MSAALLASFSVPFWGASERVRELRQALYRFELSSSTVDAQWRGFRVYVEVTARGRQESVDALVRYLHDIAAQEATQLRAVHTTHAAGEATSFADLGCCP